MKKIIFLKKEFKLQGGLEKQALYLAEEFTKHFSDIHFLTTSKTNLPFKNHQISACSWPGFLSLEQFNKNCKKWIDRHKPEIIFGLDRNSHQTHLRMGNGLHKIFLEKRSYYESSFKQWTFKINPYHRKILSLEKKGIENPYLKALFVNSAMVKNSILRHFKIEEKKIHVIHNGVEWKKSIEFFQNWQEEKKLFSKKIQLDPHCFHFIFIGNGYFRKGLKPLLIAFSKLKEKEVHLSIIGKESNINYFKALSKKLKIDHKTTFFQKVNDCKKFYALGDCLIIPSYYDPFANVTIEALNMGMRVLTSKDNGGHEIINDQNGWILNHPNEIENFSFLLEKALQYPKTLKSSLNIRNNIQHLDFSNQLKKICDLTL